MTRFLQFLREAAHALRRLEVAVKQDDAANGILGKHEAAVVVNPRAVDADHQHLPDFLGKRHMRKNGFYPFFRRHLGFVAVRSRLRSRASAARGEEQRDKQRGKKQRYFMFHRNSSKKKRLFFTVPFLISPFTSDDRRR